MNALYNASIQDKSSIGLTSFALPEANSSKTGVSVRYAPAEDKLWYVLRIKYGKSQAVADAIIEDGTYVYLAKVWKDVRNKETGKKQRKLFPFMNLLLFMPQRRKPRSMSRKARTRNTRRTTTIISVQTRAA